MARSYFRQWGPGVLWTLTSRVNTGARTQSGRFKRLLSLPACLCVCVGRLAAIVHVNIGFQLNDRLALACQVRLQLILLAVLRND